MAFTHALTTNNYGVAKLIVATSAANGTHTTLASAMADASVGDTIFLRDSVTENVTITPGVNISAWSGGSLNTPSITGTLTMTGAGTSTISGLELITNSAAIIAVTGSAASILNINDCYLNCSNNTGITYSSSSSSSQLNVNNCRGNLGTTGIAYFSHSSAGSITFSFSLLNNSGLSLTASTVSGAGIVQFVNSVFNNPITTSSTSTFFAGNSIFNPSVNATTLTIGGTGNNNMNNCSVNSGSSSSISVGAGAILNISFTTIASSNTNAITGAGTLVYSGLVFTSSSKINTTTQTGGTLQGGLTQAPTAGWLGQQISSYGSSVSLTSNIAANITSISLTAGVWDIGIVSGVNFSIGGTYYAAGINTVSATLPSSIFNDYNQMNTSSGAINVAIPSYRVVLTTTTTYYLVGVAGFGSGTGTGAGRISATRVG